MRGDRYSRLSGMRRGRPGECAWGWLCSDDEHDGTVFIAAFVPHGTCMSVPPAAGMWFQPRAFRARMGASQVEVILLLFRIAGCGMTFMVPVNHHHPAIPNPLVEIIKTGIVRVAFFEDEAWPEKEVRCDINLEAFQGALDAVAKAPRWTEAEFDAALKALTVPPEVLWDMPVGGITRLN
jgi:hypothetical protein